MSGFGSLQRSSKSYLRIVPQPKRWVLIGMASCIVVDRDLPARLLITSAREARRTEAHEDKRGDMAMSVLIVGAGPAGLFAACELLRHGIRPRVVERRPAPHQEARGTALQPAVLAALERAGLIEPFLQAGVRIKRIQLLGPGLREIISDDFTEVPCAYPFQCSLPQWRTETILREHLQRLGLEIEFGTEVKSIEDQSGWLTGDARGRWSQRDRCDGATCWARAVVTA